MTPFWLDLGLAFWLAAFVGLLGLVATFAAAFWQRRRRAAEGLRRAVLSQLLLAARRGHPLSRALSALGEELDRRGTPDPTRVVLLDPLLFLPRRFERGAARAQARVVHDLAANLEHSDLHCLSRAPAAFPAPLPQLLVQAQRRGTLVGTLEELAVLDDEALRVRGEVRGRLLYPAWVVLLTFVCALFVDRVIWDKLEEILAGVSNDPATPTHLLVLVAVRRTLLFGIPLLVGCLWLAAGALVTDRGWLARRLPVVRRLQAGFVRARVLRLLLAHLRVGAPLAETLRALALHRLAPDAAVERAVAAATEGAGLRDALLAGRLLPDADLERLPAGGGHEVAALELLARAASREASTRVDRVALAVLPLLLGLVGLLLATTYGGPHLVYHAFMERVSLW